MKRLISKCITLYGKYEEIVNYLFWGAMAFFLYMLIYWIFTSVLGLKETLAVLIDNIIVIIFAFFTNKIFVFKSKSNSAGAFFKELLEFFAARIFTMILSEIITYLGSDVMGLRTDTNRIFSFVNDGLIVQLVNQFIVIVANYILSKLWIFKKNNKASDK